METSNCPANGNAEQVVSSTYDITSTSHNHGDGGACLLPSDEQKVNSNSSKTEKGAEKTLEVRHTQDSTSSAPDRSDGGSLDSYDEQRVQGGSNVSDAEQLNKKEEEGKWDSNEDVDTLSPTPEATQHDATTPIGLRHRRQETSAESTVSHAEPHNEEEVEVKDSKKVDGEEHVQSSSLPAEVQQEDVSKPKDWLRYTFVALVVTVVAVCIAHWLSTSPQPEPQEDGSVDIFRREFEKVKSHFPSQRAELWKRSKIHVEKHLQTAQPTEPVSMILTSGRRAERTLQCLASHMAAAFSQAHNATVLHIDGISEAKLDSDQAKLDIDNKLKDAFEGDKRAAVIHRIEELPPGSTLIFYRYCDHENAAYKKVFLVFTILLPVDEVSAELSLKAVEEVVQDYLQKRFLSSSQPVTFNHMDVDKFGGLWSRISHLILPVVAEQGIEEQGCAI